MNNRQDSEKMVFVVTVGDIQQESVRLIGRNLTNEELETAIKEIEWGLSTGIYIVFKAAIDQALELNRRA